MVRMRYRDIVKMSRVHWILLGVASLTFACSGDTVDTELFSYDCKMGQFPACTCLALSGGEMAPTCDAGMVSCFKDPCQTKTAACVNNQCVVQ